MMEVAAAKEGESVTLFPAQRPLQRHDGAPVGEIAKRGAERPQIVHRCPLAGRPEKRSLACYAAVQIQYPDKGRKLYHKAPLLSAGKGGQVPE